MSFDHIEVLPNLSRTNKQPNKRFDPDVETILKPKKKDVNILDMKHEPTQEERDGGGNAHTESSWSWLIIGLALIVIALIIIIVWYVLKENEETNECKPNNIPPDIIRPTMYPPQYNQMARYPNQMQPHMPLAPQHMPQQTEHMPLHTKTMRQSEKKQDKKQPTKAELEARLKQMQPIQESGEEGETKTLQPSKKQKQNENVSQNREPKIEVVPEDEDNSQLDNQMSKTFYTNLQQSIDHDDVEEEEEEGENILE